ncbi:hypothetical protein [Streptococcus orisasini]|uniref:hypothetical protein n=1 Tax=Streptococcus orisasini TaxID=1080071 RepID=UPI00070AD3A3|nr:hypothetical protein [Streptococcus orisasini]
MKIKDFLIKFIPFSLFFIVGIFVIFGSNNPHYTISGSYFEYNDHLISNSESLKITEYTQGNDKMFIIELYNVDLPQKIYYSLIPDSKGKKHII